MTKVRDATASAGNGHAARPDEIAPTRRAGDVRRPRTCLKCGSLFDSEWSGQRICKRCQSGSAWKQGWGGRR